MVGTFDFTQQDILFSINDEDLTPFILFGGSNIWNDTDFPNLDSLQMNVEIINGNSIGQIRAVVIISGASATN